MPGRLRRSNSDPSLGSSLGTAPLASVAAAAASGPPPAQRRVTFHGTATAFDGSHSGSSGLQRHSTAPSASLAQYAQDAAAASVSMVGHLYLLETTNELSYGSGSGSGSGSFGNGGSVGSSLLQGGGMRRRSASVHSLPGLDLQSAAAPTAEASFNQGTPAGLLQPACSSLLAPACLPGCLSACMLCLQN